MPDQVLFVAGLYAGGTAKDDPLLSPLLGDLHTLPPLVIHASDSELLRDDSVLLARKAEASGTAVTLQLWHGLPHAWPNFAGLMPEADTCLAESATALLQPAEAHLKSPAIA